MLAVIAILWCLIGQSVAEAQELMSSQSDPRILLGEGEQTKEDRKQIKKMLRRYAKGSKYVVIGEVVNVNRLPTGNYKDQEAYIEVYGWLRGEPEDADTIIRIVKPYNAPYIPTDWETVPGVLIDGYSIVIFLDDQFRVVEGNAVFYTDGEFLWRNKRKNLFLHPHYDREWKGGNPYDDYVITSLAAVADMLDAQKPAPWLR